MAKQAYKHYIYQLPQQKAKKKQPNPGLCTPTTCRLSAPLVFSSLPLYAESQGIKEKLNPNTSPYSLAWSLSPHDSGVKIVMGWRVLLGSGGEC